MLYKHKKYILVWSHGIRPRNGMGLFLQTNQSILKPYVHVTGS